MRHLTTADYLPRSVPEGENISLKIDHFKTMKPACNLGWDLGTDAKIVYTENQDSNAVHTDLLIEDVIIEKKNKPIRITPESYDDELYLPDEEDLQIMAENRFISGTYVLAGIPTQRFNWIRDNVFKLHGPISFEDLYTSQGYSWVHVYLLPELTRKNNVTCQAFKQDLNRTEPIGTVTDVLKNFKSNLIGFGQFTVLVTKDHGLVFFLTGFQLIDTITVQRFPQPGLRAYPSDAVTQKLKKTSSRE